jgi:4-hydroxybenzoate polyprenyltransferase
MLWTAGFDILYACQDYDFDRDAGLHSIPKKFGIKNALIISRVLHVIMFAALVLFYWIAELRWLGLIGVLATGALLIYQHRLVKPDDLSRLNSAFFTTNAFVSVILLVTMGSDALLF